MKQFSYKDYPMRLFGAPLAGTETPFFRLPEEIRSSVRETLSGLGAAVPVQGSVSEPIPGNSA